MVSCFCRSLLTLIPWELWGASETVCLTFCFGADVVALRPRNHLLCVAGAGQAVLALKGRKSLVQTELWSWVLAGFPSSLSPLRFLGIKKKKKSKHTNQVFLFTVLREGRHFGKGRSFPQVIQEERENSVKKLWLQIFGIFFAKFYKREIHSEFWELLQAAREGLIACLIFFWEEENSSKGVWMAGTRLGFCSSLCSPALLWGRVSVPAWRPPTAGSFCGRWPEGKMLRSGWSILVAAGTS